MFFERAAKSVKNMKKSCRLPKREHSQSFIFAKNPNNLNDPNTVGSEFGAAAKRLEVFIDSAVGNWKLYLNNNSRASQLLESGQWLADCGEGQYSLIKGYIENISPEMVNEKAIFDQYVVVEGKSVGIDLARQFVKASFITGEFQGHHYVNRLGDIFDVALKATGSRVGFDYSCMQSNSAGTEIVGLKSLITHF
jgi:hypothetical protein